VKIIILNLSLAAALMTGCQSTTSSQSRWNDMFTDIALRHQYERYSCGYRASEGFSKDSGWRTEHVAARSAVKETSLKSAPAPENTYVDRQAAQQASDAVRELSAKIEVLEEALKSNVSATNQNQNLLVEQINALKGQLSELQSRPVAISTPPPRQTQSGIRIPGND
jgi:hypothetical protein